MFDYITAFEELRFTTDEFFTTVAVLLSEGKNCKPTLESIANQYLNQGSDSEIPEILIYIHLLEEAVDEISHQMQQLGLQEETAIDFHYFGMKNQKLFLTTALDYVNE